MNVTSIDNLSSPAPTPGFVGQGTATEMARAVAEVQAAVVVAQQVPRDISTARAAMQVSCEEPKFAESAFYRFRRGGSPVSGLTIGVARELARCFGNIQYGLVELRREDEGGYSEMQAFAWDVQMNTRSAQTFIVPHRRDTKKGPAPLTDVRDVYENNASQGGRRLRQQIFAVLPDWFVSEAQETITKTLGGDGKDLADRITGAINVFDALGIDVATLVTKLGRPADKWTTYDVATLKTIHRSISRGEVAIVDEFPQMALTADDIAPVEPVPALKPAPTTKPVAAVEAAPKPSEQIDYATEVRQKAKAKKVKLHDLLAHFGKATVDDLVADEAMANDALQWLEDK